MLPDRPDVEYAEPQDNQRVLIVDLSERYGGADTRVAQLATLCKPHGDLAVAVLENSETHKRFEACGIPVFPISRSKRDPRLTYDMMTLIRRFRPHVVDAHNPQSLLWSLPPAFACGIPKRIATIHSMYEVSEHTRNAALVYGSLYKLVEMMATHVVSVSPVVSDHIVERGISPAKIHTIPNGIPRADPAERRTSPTEVCRVACVGRLVPVKGQTVLLEAISKLDPVLNAEFWFIGDGPERATLESRADALGIRERVTFWGNRDNVPKLLRACHALCLPSLTEGLPFAALEAASLGLPIIASRVGGLAQHFDSGTTALLVAPNDPRALSDAIAMLVADPEHANTLGRAGQEMVRRDYALSTTIADTMRVYGLLTTNGDNRPVGRAQAL